MKHPTLEKFFSNNTSGSTELAAEINNFFKRNANHPQVMQNAIRIIKEGMQNFEVIIKHATIVEKLIKNKDSVTLQKYLDEFVTRDQDSFYKIYNNSKKYLKNKNIIYTLSNSRTVFEVLRLVHSKNKNLKLIIAESRPAFEGRILAKKFFQVGVKVKLIADCDSPSHILKCDAVVIGADKILSNQAIVNKIGSYNAAILAKYFKKPLYVLASDEKISNKKIFKDKLQSSKEVWSFNHKILEIENHYFEVVPKELITKIIT